MPGVEVLVVQGAPVTDAVLDASAELRLVCCARGGPVNVDVDAVSERGLPLVNTPGQERGGGRRPDARLPVMLARGFPRAQRFLDEGNQLRDNWEGAKFIGSDLAGTSLGLVGYGQVGHRVAMRALAFGLTVLVYDPYLDVDRTRGSSRSRRSSELLARARLRLAPCAGDRRQREHVRRRAFAQHEARVRSSSTPPARRSWTRTRSTRRSHRATSPAPRSTSSGRPSGAVATRCSATRTWS